MNAKTLEAVRRHGLSILAAFPNAIEKDPVALCKKLRRIEAAVANTILAYSCDNSSGLTQDDLDHACQMAQIRCGTLLGLDRHGIALAGLFVNRDPRGYALKLDNDDASGWFAHWQKNCLEIGGDPIYTDWGGYGIIAPDLTVEERVSA